MNIAITTFKNPFCFYCIAEEDAKDIEFVEEPVETTKFTSSKIDFADVTHGQYVAVMWKNKWARGLVTIEQQFLIWLIDYGIYLRPDEKTVYTSLPPTYKKLPTKVFEASIHGVSPIERTLTDECEIKNKISNTWTAGAIEKAQKLIATATQLYFVPVALMSTKFNDVVIGDLYLEIDSKIVNIIDELILWPVFLEKNGISYTRNLSAHYSSRKKHRSCSLKPAIADKLPTMSPETTLGEYDAICAAAPEIVVDEECCDSADGSTELGYACSTVVDYTQPKQPTEDKFKLTAAEIEKYSNAYIEINGEEFNVLNLLINKIRDLKMCAMYRDHDLKSVGCGYTRWSRKDFGGT